MTTKHVKTNPTIRYNPRNVRRRRKKLKLLIGAMIFLQVYGVFLKGALAEDVSTKDEHNDVPTTKEADKSVETSIDNIPSPVIKSGIEYNGNKNDSLRRLSDVTSTNKLPYRVDRVGHGTEHEQVGIPHFRPIALTPFVPKLNYTNPGPKHRYGMDPVFKMSNSILNVMVPYDTFPTGYVEIRGDRNFRMGHRVYNNDWLPLLSRYWLVWIIVLLILVLIIVIPFIAVCYCCFCCHKRCGRHCPPCDEEPDKRSRCVYGILLFLLIIGLLCGIIICFATNRLLETGFAESTRNIGRSSDDTCRFLTNTNNHIKHLYKNNYQEMLTQLTAELDGGHEHISVDLVDVSKAVDIQELLKFIENMPKALKLMVEIEQLEKDARFYASQLRDGLRGTKRDLAYMRYSWCDYPSCEKLYQAYDIHLMDRGCLHYDNVPNTTIYVEAIKDIIKENLEEIPLKALEKLKGIDDIIQELHALIIPTMMSILSGGSAIMSEQAEIISLLVDKVISDIHLKTMRSSHSFDDIYSKLGVYRNLTNIILCSVLLIILMCLIIALCCGCFAKRRRGYRDDCCNKGTGATCLLIAMLLIFLTFSIIALIGLFYFVFGLLAYYGACAPLRDTTRNKIFNSFDSLIDFYKISPPVKSGYIGEDNSANQVPPIRLSTALNACRSNESIIDVLQMNQFYSIRNLELLKILKKLSDYASEVPLLPNTLQEMELISNEDMKKLSHMRNVNLSSYHSKVYKEEMCKNFPDFPLRAMIERLQIVVYESPSGSAPRIGYINILTVLRQFERNLHRKLVKMVDDIHIKVDQIDKLILYKDLNFNESVSAIIDSITKAQDFIRQSGVHYINDLTANLTSYVVREVGSYKDYVVDETKFNVGRCKPLAYIYENGVDIVCNRMVDPMNGFGVGVLLCCLLFLPTLWVAHKLQCLYKKVGLYGTPVATGGSHTGAPGPTQPATVLVCSDGVGNNQCPCPLLRQNIPKSAQSEAIMDPRSPQGKRDRNNENSGTRSEWGDFFDVEAQQRFVPHRSSQEFSKRKID